MPARTGTASVVDASAGNGSTSVTVPAGASSAVAFWSHYDGGAESTLSGLTLGGNAYSIEAQLPESDGTTHFRGVGVAVLNDLPGTGAQTLAWTWSAGAERQEGGELIVVWIDEDVEVVDAGVDSTNTETGETQVVISREADDLGLAHAVSFGTQTIVLDGTTFIDGTEIGDCTSDDSELDAADGTVDMTGEFFSAMAAISLRTLGGGANEGDVAADSQAAELSAAGVRASEGAAALASAAATSDIVGHKQVDGDLAMSAQAHALDITGSAANQGSVDLQSQAADLDADGVRRSIDVGEGFGISAQPAQTEIAGTRRIIGTLAAAAQSSTASVLGTRLLPGSMLLVAQGAPLAVNGTRRLTGGAALESGNPTPVFSGTRRIIGTAVIGMGGPLLDVAGVMLIDGTLTLQAAAHDLDIDGEAGNAVVGDVAAASDPATTVLDGITAHLGDLAPNAGAVLLTADGIVRRTGDAGMVAEIAALDIAGTFLFVISGDVAAVADTMTLEIDGTKRSVGTFDAQSEAARLLIQQMTSLVPREHVIFVAGTRQVVH